MGTEQEHQTNVSCETSHGASNRRNMPSIIISKISLVPLRVDTTRTWGQVLVCGLVDNASDLAVAGVADEVELLSEHSRCGLNSTLVTGSHKVGDGQVGR